MRASNETVIIFGITGMVGSQIFRTLSNSKNLSVFGTSRDSQQLKYLPKNIRNNIFENISTENLSGIEKILKDLKPTIAINCIGVIKQSIGVNNIANLISVNSLFPHLLAKLCSDNNIRLIHISTDCVFSGEKGDYFESDIPDCMDAYGRSKLLGEIDNLNNVLTLRTSIIGHELNNKLSLIDWFLDKKGSVFGFTNAIFSGIPTIELANILRDIVIPKPDLYGLYHLSTSAISKYDLLSLVAQEYGKNINIIPIERPVIDRSLNSKRFGDATGYEARSWPLLIKDMHNEYLQSQIFK